MKMFNISRNQKLMLDILLTETIILDDEEVYDEQEHGAVLDQNKTREEMDIRAKL